MKKTNAARLLDRLKIEYETVEYPVDESDLSAEHVAAAIGQPLERVFKTLVARGDKTGIVVACVPGGAELDLKALASASGNKRVALVPMKEVLPLTGYMRGGCSPLGMKKNYPVYIDEDAFQHDTIYFSAGLRGLQLHMTPSNLQKAADATKAKLTHTS